MKTLIFSHLPIIPQKIAHKIKSPADV